MRDSLSEELTNHLDLFLVAIKYLRPDLLADPEFAELFRPRRRY
jgi:hypothetical protein